MNITPELVKESWEQCRERALFVMATEHEPFNYGITKPTRDWRAPDTAVLTFEWHMDGHIYCTNTGMCVE